MLISEGGVGAVGKEGKDTTMLSNHVLVRATLLKF